MKQLLYFILLTGFILNGQENKVYKAGEKLTFRVHYGIINAGYASIEVKESSTNNHIQEHILGKGWTTGMLRWVFPVKDDYQTFIDKETGFPNRFIRNIKEGKYTKNVELFFEKDSVLTIDHKHKKETKVAAQNVQDMISAFYYLRNNVPDSLKVDESVDIDLFFDCKKFPFKLKKLRKETLKTKFGKIECIVFRPMVQSGRIFKAKESLSIWITADKNRIPVRIQADLAVGSLKADIHEYKGLLHPFNTH